MLLLWSWQLDGSYYRTILSYHLCLRTTVNGYRIRSYRILNDVLAGKQLRMAGYGAYLDAVRAWRVGIIFDYLLSYYFFVWLCGRLIYLW